MKGYGITAKASVENKIQGHIEEFQILGYTIIEGVLSESELDDIRIELDRVYAIQEAEIGKEFLSNINEEYLARALSAYSDNFINLACHPQMMEFIKIILGNYFILHLQNGIINMPSEEHHQSNWHRDLPYQNWVSSEPIGCNLFYCLDEFSKETGGTILLPFSHKLAFMPSDQFVEKHSVQIEAPAGSVVLFDSMLFHKAGFNQSGKIRRGINHLYGRAILRQQIDLPSMMTNREPSDPFQRMVLGFDNKSPTSVSEFREIRFQKKRKAYE
jgi:ectoine hydroxylase-related dioxygenase (phytanoyl-CoA dioxygenase family)